MVKSPFRAIDFLFLIEDLKALGHTVTGDMTTFGILEAFMSGKPFPAWFLNIYYEGRLTGTFTDQNSLKTFLQSVDPSGDRAITWEDGRNILHRLSEVVPEEVNTVSMCQKVASSAPEVATLFGEAGYDIPEWFLLRYLPDWVTAAELLERYDLPKYFKDAKLDLVVILFLLEEIKESGSKRRFDAEDWVGVFSDGALLWKTLPELFGISVPRWFRTVYPDSVPPDSVPPEGVLPDDGCLGKFLIEKKISISAEKAIWVMKVFTEHLLEYFRSNITLNGYKDLLVDPEAVFSEFQFGLALTSMRMRFIECGWGKEAGTERYLTALEKVNVERSASVAMKEVKELAEKFAVERSASVAMKEVKELTGEKVPVPASSGKPFPAPPCEQPRLAPPPLEIKIVPTAHCQYKNCTNPLLEGFDHCLKCVIKRRSNSKKECNYVYQYSTPKHPIGSQCTRPRSRRSMKCPKCYFKLDL